jgi:Ca2+-binding RTX toxin-like protein
VIAGNGAFTFTNITPSGNAVTYIAAGDGNNVIATTPGTSGNYAINTGTGNDTISVSGNAVVNAGTGTNLIAVTGGNALIYSEGYDSITGSAVAGGGMDTVNVGSGQATINPGTSNFVIYSTSAANTNPLIFDAGSGSDTISVGLGGGTVTGGSAGNNILYAGAGGPGGAPTTLFGTADGDQLYASGNTVAFVTAGAGNETISGAGGTPTGGVSVFGSAANNTFKAGSGNDTLIAGAGNDTLMGGTGHALMVSGTGADTFSFTFGTGGNDTITGFKATDTLQLTGYGITMVPASSVGAGTLISLSDGTTITLSSVTSLNPNQVVLN